jgi:uncharacterized protein YukE
MAQVIVSPSQLRGFARDLAELTGDIKNRERQLDGALKDLGSTWRDEKYRKFSASYTTMSIQLQMFYRLSERYVTFLGSKAAAADRFLGR